MADIAIDISDLLAAAGVGSVTPPNVTIFCGRLESAPDTAIAVRPMPGSHPVSAMGASLCAPVRIRPDVQIMVRGLNWIEHQAIVAGTQAALDRFKGIIDGKEYYISQAYDAIYLGVDENNRHQTSLVFNVVRER